MRGTSIGLLLFLLGTAAAAGCSSAGDATGATTTNALEALDPSEIVGDLAYGQTSSAVAYTETPRFRAFRFTGAAGDTVEAVVHSPDGYPKAWVVASDFSTLATAGDGLGRDAALHTVLSASGTYYVAFREFSLEDASFTVTLKGTTSAPHPPPGGTVPGGPVPPGSPTSLDIVRDQTLDGEVVVDGPLVVHSGATVTVSSGKLLVRAQSITVETGASIVVSPDPDAWIGRGESAFSTTGGGGGGYAYSGFDSPRAFTSEHPYSSGGHGGSAHDLRVWPWIESGGPGGVGGENPQVTPYGGGHVALFATHIDVGGGIQASGVDGSPNSYSASGGGSGGGILLAGETVSITGSISVSGGSGGVMPPWNGGDGADGRVKILSPAAPATGGRISGYLESSLLPPTWIASSTHPDPSATYFDGTGDAEVHWNRAFANVAGYYVYVTPDANTVATQSNGKFQAAESIVVPRASLDPNGTTYVHVVSVDQSGNVGLNEARFAITLSSAIATVASNTHPDRSQWPNRTDAAFTWTLPGSVKSANFYYVLDHYGTTLPSKSDTKVQNRQLFFSNLANGVWALHLRAEDAAGNLTSQAAHYVFNVGPNPGICTILGTTSNAQGPVAGAQINVNRGLFQLSSDSAGSYNFQQLPAGTWEITASYQGVTAPVRSATLAAGAWQRVDFAF